MDANRGGKGDAGLEQVLKSLAELLSRPSPDPLHSLSAISMPDRFTSPVTSPNLSIALGGPPTVGAGGASATSRRSEPFEQQSPKKSDLNQAFGTERQPRLPITMTDMRLRRMGESEAWNHMSRLMRERPSYTNSGFGVGLGPDHTFVDRGVGDWDRRQSGTAPPSSDRAQGKINDETAVLLQPLLRLWLTENLPRMVEKALVMEGRRAAGNVQLD
jgi:hypothetical protein